MAKISRQSEPVVSSVQDRPVMATEAKEIYCLDDGANLSRNLAEQDADEDEGAEDDEEVNHDEMSRGNHLVVQEQQAAIKYHHQHQQQKHNHINNGHHHLHHNHHHQPHQHTPTCKLVNTELSLGPNEPTRYQNRPHCMHHHDHQPLHAHHHLHKPNCAVHNGNQLLGSNQKLFKNLIAQQHIQLSAATMNTAEHNGGAESAGRLHAVYRPSASTQHQQLHHQMRYLKSSPQVITDKSKYLHVEYHQRPSGHRSSNLAPSLSLSGDSVHNDDRRQRINIRHHRSRHLPTTNVDGHTRQAGTLGDGDKETRQKHTKKTTVNFIAQLYFLIHLSATISLLLHHKNLVSNESRATDSGAQHLQQSVQTIQQSSQQEQQQHQQQIYSATTRRNSQVALPPSASAAAAATAHRPDHSGDMHQRRRHMQRRPNASDSFPSLPVPQATHRRPNVHQINELHYPHPNSLHELMNDGETQLGSGRPVRSILGPDLNSHSLDARSSDILVRLVGRTHAKSALQYFLCYLLSSSITILIFLWLVRICTAPSKYEGAQWAKGTKLTRRGGGSRLIETRQDCTPVLIGSISLGLIQLIVIGLDIADNIDWLTTSPSPDNQWPPLGPTASYSEQTRAGSSGGQWPIFVPMLQFVFVSLLMQYILAKVARIRGFAGLTGDEDERTEEEAYEEGESERPVQRLRKSGRPQQRTRHHRAAGRVSLSDNLQNIALAHLLVTHILLWLMKLNSISLFHGGGGGGNLEPHQQVFVPFVMSPLPPPPPITTSGSGSTTLPPATTSSTMQQPRRTTSLPSFALDQFGAAGDAGGQSTISSVAPEQQGERNNGQQSSTTAAPADERPRREKVLSSLRNANSFADNHLTDARTKQPQFVIVATRAVDSSSSHSVGGTGGAAVSSTTTPTTNSPTITTTSRSPSEVTMPVLDDTRAPGDESDAHHDRDEIKLISLVPPPISIESSSSSSGGSTTTRSPLGLPPSTTRASDQVAAAAENNTKNERDLHANSRRRPLAPETLDDDNDRLEPIQVVSERPPTTAANGSSKQRVSLSPMLTSPVRVETKTPHRVKPASSSQPTLTELRPANFSASQLFKSSLPKRMTAFTQRRPSQRVNLASSSSSSSSSSSGSGTTSSSRPASTSASTAPPLGSTTTASSSDKKFLLKSSQPSVEQTVEQEERPSQGGERHRVRVIVDREQSFPRPIDLTAVIPAPSLNQTGEEEEESENDIQDSPPGGTSLRTTDRPFPSVDDDPPPTSTRPTTSTSTSTKSPRRTINTSSKRGQLDGQEKEREPDESVAVVNQTRIVAVTPTRGDSRATKSTTALPRPVTTTATPSVGGEDGQVEDDEEEDSPGEENEVDLDALLPPVPNYSNETSDATSGSGGGGGGEDPQTDEEALKLLMSEPPRRRARKMRLGNNVTSLNQTLLDEAAFVFNEAASSQVANVTARPKVVGSNETVKWANLTDMPSRIFDLTLPSNNTQSLHSVGKEALTMQQQQQQQQRQQPTFSDFLLPIVQQYHILVLTILFNMWLDSMQQRRAKRTLGKENVSSQKQPTVLVVVKRDQSQPVVSRRRSTPKRRILDRSSSSSRDLSPVRSSVAHSSSSAILSGRSLSEADLLAHGADSSSMSRGSSTKQLVSALELEHNKRRDRPRLMGDTHQVVARRRHATACDQSRGIQSELQVATEISSSVCSVFFGLLVVSGSLIVILLGVDLLSLLIQCTIQLISVAICLLGLCIVWRIKKNARRLARQLEARRRLRSRGRDQSKALKIGPVGGQQQQQQQQVGGEHEAISHKSSFHYLFLLAAYYCGISVALNLGQQHQIARLFPPPVVQFLQRLFANGRQMEMMFGEEATPYNPPAAPATPGHTTMILNLQLLFYGALSLKGLVLIIQVTLQTILIRSSWRWSGARVELRQIYTFLMFTNLSLWALEICDQQQQMLLVKHQHQQQVGHLQQMLLPPASPSHNFELLTLEGFTRFAGSVVTLSHLYHGLVFMQH